MPSDPPSFNRRLGAIWFAFMAGITVTSIAVTLFLLATTPTRHASTLQLSETASAAVEYRELRASKVVSGKLQLGSTIGGLPEGQKVTGITKHSVPNGAATPVAELNGEPVFALPSETGLWRDLTPGDVGKDVRDIQDYLRKNGYRKSKVTGTYDKATSEQLARLLTKAGYGHLTKAPSLEAPPVEANAPAAIAGEQGSQPEAPAGPAWIMPCRQQWFFAVPASLTEVGPGNLRLGATTNPESHFTTSGSATRYVVADGGRVAQEIGDRARSGSLALSIKDMQPATITSVNSTTEHSEFIIALAPNSEPMTQEVVTANIELDRTPGNVLAVPQRAIRDDEQHGTHVLKITPDTETGQTIVPVTTGFVGQGWVAVTSPDLAASDQVVIP